MLARRPIVVANDLQLDFYRLCAAARPHVVKHEQGGESYLEQALREALQQTRRHTEHGPEARRRLDQRRGTDKEGQAPAQHLICL